MQRNSAFAGAIGSALGIQLSLAVSGIVVARMLGVTGRGHLALLMLMPVMIAQLGSLGIPAAATFFIARDVRGRRGVVRAIAMPAAMQAIVLTLLHAVIVWRLVNGDPSSIREAGWLTLIGTPAILGQQYAFAVLQGEQRFTTLNLLRVIAPLIYSVGGVGLALVRLGNLETVAIVWVLSYGGVCVLGVLAVLRELRRAPYGERVQRRPLFSYGLRSLAGWVSPVEGLKFDQAIVGLFLSPRVLGLYVVGLALTNLPRFIAQSVGMVGVAQVASEVDPIAARRELRRFVLLGVIACGAVVVVLELVSGRVIPLLFGEEFSGAVDVSRLLLLSAFLLCVRRLLADGARGLNRPLSGTSGELASWLALVPGIALLAPRFGVLGVAGALIISSGLSVAIVALTMMSASRVDRARPAGGMGRAVMACTRTATVSGVRRNLWFVGPIAASLLVGYSVPLTSTWIVLVLLAALVVLVPAVRAAVRRYGRHLGALSFGTALGIGFVTGAVMTTPWNAVKVPVPTTGVSVAPSYLMLPPGIFLLALAWSRERSGRLPQWLLFPGVGVTAAAILTLIDPPGSAYMASRIGHVKTALAASALSSSGSGNFVRLGLCLVLLPTAIAMAVGLRSWVARVIIDLWAMAGVISAAVAFSDYSHLTSVSRGLLGVAFAPHREPGLTTQANHVAVMSVLATLVVLSWISRGPKWCIGGLASLCVLALGVYASGSRGGAVGFVFALVLGVAFVPSLRVHLRKLVVLVAAALMVIITVMPGDSIRALFSQTRLSSSSMTAYQSDVSRRDLIGQAVHDVVHRPLQGVGLGVANDAHDIYLQLLASLGILGFCAFGVFVIGVVRSARLASRADPVTARLLVVQIMAWLLLGVAENQLLTTYTYVPDGVVIGLGVIASAAGVRQGVGRREVRRPTPEGRGFVAPVAP